MKTALIIIGAISVVLAVLGLFLPLLPTTPFLLLASACFARGSDKMHKWLLNHGLFGAYLRSYEEGKGIPLRGKIVAITLLWVSMTVSMAMVGQLALRLLLAAIGLAVTIYLWKFVPTRIGSPAP
ncbi:YbaN family protein [Pseudoduganella sp. GCM10020061]|uniref:YbaN family protein n=1 Tax=Pseudoduganella sp. GCM10020061 TaxID=3317345 RepID=UPI00363563E0